MKAKGNLFNLHGEVTTRILFTKLHAVQKSLVLLGHYRTKIWIIFLLLVLCVYSECKSVNTVSLLVLHEGVPYEDLSHTNRDEEIRNKSRMEELARSVAVDELSDEVFLFLF